MPIVPLELAGEARGGGEEGAVAVGQRGARGRRCRCCS